MSYISLVRQYPSELIEHGAGYLGRALMASEGDDPALHGGADLSAPVNGPAPPATVCM